MIDFWSFVIGLGLGFIIGVITMFVVVFGVAFKGLLERKND